MAEFGDIVRCWNCLLDIGCGIPAYVMLSPMYAVYMGGNIRYVAIPHPRAGKQFRHRTMSANSVISNSSPGCYLMFLSSRRMVACRAYMVVGLAALSGTIYDDNSNHDIHPAPNNARRNSVNRSYPHSDK
jgi:hypothetical protein